MSSPIPPPGSNFITLEKFLEMKALYGVNSQSILAPQYQNKEILITCETFNPDIITAITTVTGYAGFRVYYGMSPDLKVHAMLIATDSQGRDILPDPSSNKANVRGGGVAGEEGTRCPPDCPH